MEGSFPRVNEKSPRATVPSGRENTARKQIAGRREAESPDVGLRPAAETDLVGAADAMIRSPHRDQMVAGIKLSAAGQVGRSTACRLNSVCSVALVGENAGDAAAFTALQPSSSTPESASACWTEERWKPGLGEGTQRQSPLSSNAIQ